MKGGEYSKWLRCITIIKNLDFTKQKLFPALIERPGLSAALLAEELNLLQDSSMDSILPIVKDVIAAFPQKVDEYKKGKKAIVTMFMGEVMKRSKGKADPKLATDLIVQELNK